MTGTTVVKRTNIITLILLVFAVAIGTLVLYFNKHIVADYVNFGDFMLTPIEYNGQLYFQSGKKYQEDTYEKLGYVLDQNSVFDVILCMFFANDLYAIDENKDHLRVEHDMSGSYSVSSVFENKEYTDMIFSKYTEFELLFHDQNGEFLIGSLDISKDIVQSLEVQFGNISYNTRDFNTSDNNYYMYVKSPNKDPFGLKDDSFLFVGVIMEKDGNYYYGNLDNQIDENNANSIKQILWNS